MKKNFEKSIRPLTVSTIKWRTCIICKRGSSSKKGDLPGGRSGLPWLLLKYHRLYPAQYSFKILNLPPEAPVNSWLGLFFGGGGQGRRIGSSGSFGRRRRRARNSHLAWGQRKNYSSSTATKRSRTDVQGVAVSVGNVNNASIKIHGVGDEANGGIAGGTPIEKEVFFILAGTAGVVLSLGDFELTAVLLVVDRAAAVKSHKVILAIINKAPKDDKAPVSSVLAHRSPYGTEGEIRGIIEIDVLVKLDVGEVPPLFFFTTIGNP